MPYSVYRSAFGAFPVGLVLADFVDGSSECLLGIGRVASRKVAGRDYSSLLDLNLIPA